MRYEFGGLIHGRGLFWEFYGIFCMCRLWESILDDSVKQIRAQRRAAPGCLGFTGEKECFGGSSQGLWEKFNLLVVRGSETQTEKKTWY